MEFNSVFKVLMKLNELLKFVLSEINNIIYNNLYTYFLTCSMEQSPS